MLKKRELFQERFSDSSAPAAGEAQGIEKKQGEPKRVARKWEELQAG
jgi:hypothetical protein